MIPTALETAQAIAMHYPWCVDHTANGCLGVTVTLGRNVHAWLAAFAGGAPKVVIDTPAGTREVDVDPGEEPVGAEVSAALPIEESPPEPAD